MSESRDLLIEIGTEELPPKALRRMSEALADGICKGLDACALSFVAVEPLATPRRLAVVVTGIPKRQPDREIDRRGPAVNIAFDDAGEPTKAAQGFARSCGVAVADLLREERDGTHYLVYKSTEAGRPTPELLAEIAATALDSLPVPKRMRWADSAIEFSRPVHWVLMLFGEETVPATLLGLEAGNRTRGHRFHHPDTIEIARADEYKSSLREPGRVVAGFGERKAQIRAAVEREAATIGATAIIDDELLEEVTSLVEWPVPLTGSFDEEYLELPDELLIATLQSHQKYFPMLGENGQLLAHFVTISNIESSDFAAVRAGNERVVRPRLADAAFFFESDLKIPIAERQAALGGIVFQRKLGTMHDKALRIAALAATIAEAMGESAESISHTRRAGEICKFDLVTDMVGEFPELQGVMGREYGAALGEPAEVATAIGELYHPRFAGDDIPRSAPGRAIAIADKLDTLVGIFGIGQAPTGTKDPYALRRAALGILRIMIEGELDLKLAPLVAAAIRGHGDAMGKADLAATIEDFMVDRLRAYFADQGVPATVFAAVEAKHPEKPHDFARRIQAVSAFRALPESGSLSAANKRTQNILRQASEAIPGRYVSAALQEDAETALATKLEALAPGVRSMLAQGDYTGALTALAGLRESIDTFFDDVKVMDDDATVRGNRLALLSAIGELFGATADISRLQD